MIRFLLLHSNSNCLSVQSVDRFKLLQSVSVSGAGQAHSTDLKTTGFVHSVDAWCMTPPPPPPEAADI